MYGELKNSQGQWMPCLNIGDDYEVKADRRKESDLVITGHSLVEIVGIRTINEDHFVHEVRLPVGEVPDGISDDVEKFVPLGVNYAFTGPGDLLKDHQGRITFTPTMVRFEGDNVDDANAKIFGRYKAPKRTGKFSDAEYDEFERQERMFGTGIHQQLVADPAGHLKLPSNVSMLSRFSIQGKYLGWNCQGIYKFHTGEKTKGKKDDNDKTKNLLAFISPAVQNEPIAPIRFVTHESHSNYTIREYESTPYASVDQGLDLDGDSRVGQEYAVMVDGDAPVPASICYWDRTGNHKQLITFVGDNVLGTVKLILDGRSSQEISLSGGVLTEQYLTEKIENIGSVGKGNVKVSLWPGRWLVEFVGALAGQSFDLFELDILDTAIFKVHVTETYWADSRQDTEVIIPIPVIGKFDEQNTLVNDAVAPGSFGTAQWFPGAGWVADSVECRNYNGDGNPDL